MNNFSGVGRLTKSPEVRQTGSGKSVCNFTVAINRTFGDTDKADFITCTAWERTADFMGNYLAKGALVSINGRIETGSYEDSDGKMVYTTDVVVDNLQALESQSQREQQTTEAPKQEVKEDKPELDITQEDLPF